MRARAPQRADEHEAYAAGRDRLLPSICQAGPALAAQGIDVCTKRATEIHHRRKRSASGALAEPANWVPACHDCNMAIEDHPLEAHAAGLVVREGDPEWDSLSARVWRKAHAGPVPPGPARKRRTRRKSGLS